MPPALTTLMVWALGDHIKNAMQTPTGPAAAPATSPFPASTHVQVRMLHALPAGEEVVTSYFPLEWDWPTRQSQCSEQYGFACSCPRCKVW